jgi:hypothetical protein
MSKKNKLISVKLLPREDLAMSYEQTQPEFHFSVKGIVEGQKMIFKGCMKLLGGKKVEFSFDELPMCLDDWFEECQEKLKHLVITQLAHKYSHR